MPIEDTLLQKLQQLRRDLHQYPEVSGEEHNTAARIKSFILPYQPDRVLSCGGNGIIFVFEGQTKGPTVMIRSELDALAIQELNDVSYASKVEGKAHLCGHDGHMTMVAGLAAKLAEKRPSSGSVALMFQPAEETGEGAALILKDEVFDTIAPDYIFALHNLPGFKKNEIIIREGIFSSASKGTIISLKGKTSHAAEPENGISPALAVAELIQLIEQLSLKTPNIEDFALATVVHATLGERAFGVTPGKAVVMATIRAYQDADLAKLEDFLTSEVQEIAGKYNLQVQIEDTEIFSSTINDKNCCAYVKTAAQDLGLTITEADKPFSWSEDFGLFTQKYSGALFGLGSGEGTPDLHNPDFDFPDEILKTGVSMFNEIIEKLLNINNAQ